MCVHLYVRVCVREHVCVETLYGATRNAFLLPLFAFKANDKCLMKWKSCLSVKG